MSDIKAPIKRPGSITFISILLIIVSGSGISSGITNLIPILITGRPSGILLFLQEIYPYSVREIYEPIIRAMDASALLMIPMEITGFCMALFGLYTGVSLLKSKPNGLLLGKIYTGIFAGSLALTVVWVFSLINVMLAHSSGRYSGMFNSIMIFSFISGIGVAIAFIIIIFRTLQSQHIKEYYKAMYP